MSDKLQRCLEAAGVFIILAYWEAPKPYLALVIAVHVIREAIFDSRK